MIRAMRRLWWMPLLILGWSAGAAAHPGHPEGSGGADASAEEFQPSDKQRQKRIERVIRRAEQRAKNREQRTRDERRQLRLRLARHLNGGEVTPAIVEELQRNAKRTAYLRQIRYLAAKAGDYDAVEETDRLLSRENGRIERWWRDTLREARKKTAPPAASGEK
jgi:hypothetical protein